jgi:hypothetical protein
MIVIRILDNENSSECDQEIYCNNCYPIFKGKKYISNNPNMSTNNFNIYSDSIVEHDNFDGLWPTISDFLSEEYQEYCINCNQQLNILN